MNKIYYLGWLLLFFSCKKVDSFFISFLDNPSTKEEPIDFSTIDFYPIFQECNNIVTLKMSEICFEEHLYQKINQQIEKLNLNCNTTLADTVYIKFSVNTQGAFKCHAINVHENLSNNFPNLNTEIENIFEQLPKVEPALKRGIPVLSQFTIPLLITTNDE